MRRILGTALLLLAAACGDTTASVVFGVTLSPATATVTAGKTFQIGALTKGKLTWKVVEAAGGSVDANGVYTGRPRRPARTT
jgi:hypothetical protein